MSVLLSSGSLVDLLLGHLLDGPVLPGEDVEEPLLGLNPEGVIDFPGLHEPHLQEDHPLLAAFQARLLQRPGIFVRRDDAHVHQDVPEQLVGPVGLDGAEPAVLEDEALLPLVHGHEDDPREAGLEDIQHDHGEGELLELERVLHDGSVIGKS
jgi:hypothetical protein